MRSSGDCDWRKRFAAGETTQRVRPKESFARLGNPHKGTTTFQRFNGEALYPGERWDDGGAPTEFGPRQPSAGDDRYPQTTIAYCRWLWSAIEPEKGRHRWEIVDGALAAARARGQTLQVRLMPYASDDLPPWFWDLSGRRQRRETGYGFREPDINHPSYVDHWGDLIRAFGERYDGHPDLESFDIAYGGPWGEMGGNASRRTSSALVDTYLRSLRRTQLVSMLGTYGCAYAAGTGRSIGWRADCFGDLRTEGRGQVPDGLNWNHMYDAYPREVVENGVRDAWRTAPVTLETCWTVGHWHERGWDLDWIIEQGYRYHVSVFMPKSCPIPEEWMPRIEAFNRRMGYRIVLRQLLLPIEVTPGGRFEVQAWLDNVGCAPIYRRYRFAYRFRQAGKEAVVHSRQDVRTWMPGHTWFRERIAAPDWLKPGSAKLDVGIVDPQTGCARVRLAIEDAREDGWHPMALIEVAGR